MRDELLDRDRVRRSPRGGRCARAVDPTLLENGLYRVRLMVEDVNGRSAVGERVYRVSGEAKIGLLSLVLHRSVRARVGDPDHRHPLLRQPRQDPTRLRQSAGACRSTAGTLPEQPRARRRLDRHRLRRTVRAALRRGHRDSARTSPSCGSRIASPTASGRSSTNWRSHPRRLRGDGRLRVRRRYPARCDPGGAGHADIIYTSGD